MNEHVFLVAVVVRTADDRATAEKDLHTRLNIPAFRGDVGNDDVTHVDSWWIAEDDRRDGSDCDSAVFVEHGVSQRNARHILERHGA